MKGCRTMYLAKQAVMGLDDSKRTSEYYYEMLVRPTSPSGMKS